ncbi:unnamed protein product [Amoebophrya sp. A120]|nr:unnamed protein product [Amoebophrya sp. A120]|eukprot:GSA120T00010993001.1
MSFSPQQRPRSRWPCSRIREGGGSAMLWLLSGQHPQWHQTCDVCFPMSVLNLGYPCGVAAVQQGRVQSSSGGHASTLEVPVGGRAEQTVAELDSTGKLLRREVELLDKNSTRFVINPPTASSSSFVEDHAEVIFSGQDAEKSKSSGSTIIAEEKSSNSATEKKTKTEQTFSDFFWKTEDYPATEAAKAKSVAELEKFELAEPPGNFTVNSPLAPLSVAAYGKFSAYGKVPAKQLSAGLGQRDPEEQLQTLHEEPSLAYVSVSPATEQELGSSFNEFFWDMEGSYPATEAGRKAFAAKLEDFAIAEPPGSFRAPPPLAPIHAGDCVRTPQLRKLFEEELIKTPRTVVDFSYFGTASRDALEVRMQELQDQVDLFVITEADIDHRGRTIRSDYWPEVLSKQAVFRDFGPDRVLHLPLHYPRAADGGGAVSGAGDESFASGVFMRKEGSRLLHAELQKRFFAEEDHEIDGAEQAIQHQHPQRGQPTVSSWALLVLTAHTDETPSRKAVQLLRNCKFLGEKIEDHFPLRTASLMVQNLIDKAFRSDFPAESAHPYEISRPGFALFHPSHDDALELDTFAHVSNVGQEKIIYGGAHMTGYPFIPAWFLKNLQCTDVLAAAALSEDWASLHREIRQACAAGGPGTSDSPRKDHHAEKIAAVLATHNLDRTTDNFADRFADPTAPKESDTAYADMLHLPDYFVLNRNRFPAWFGKRQDPRATILCPPPASVQGARAAEQLSSAGLGQRDPEEQLETLNEEPSLAYVSVAPATELECLCPNWRTVAEQGRNREVPRSNVFVMSPQRPSLISKEEAAAMFPGLFGDGAPAWNSTNSTSTAKPELILSESSPPAPDGRRCGQELSAGIQHFNHEAAWRAVELISSFLESEKLLQDSSITLLEAFEDLNSWTMRSDLWRVAIVYLCGGVYMDGKAAAARPPEEADAKMTAGGGHNKLRQPAVLDALFSDDSETQNSTIVLAPGDAGFCLDSGWGATSKKGKVHSAFFAAPPRSSALLYILQQQIRNVQTHSRGHAEDGAHRDLDPTSPGAFSDGLLQHECFRRTFLPRCVGTSVGDFPIASTSDLRHGADAVFVMFDQNWIRGYKASRDVLHDAGLRASAGSHLHNATRTDVRHDDAPFAARSHEEHNTPFDDETADPSSGGDTLAHASCGSDQQLAQDLKSIDFEDFDPPPYDEKSSESLLGYFWTTGWLASPNLNDNEKTNSRFDFERGALFTFDHKEHERVHVYSAEKMKEAGRWDPNICGDGHYGALFEADLWGIFQTHPRPICAVALILFS